MDLNLQDKCALITGSTSGIGEAIAKTLAEEGVNVIVQGRRLAEANRVVDEIIQAGGSAVMVLGDLATEAGADQVAEASVKAFGGVDILVNNAGVYPAKGWFTETADDWNEVYNINVASTVRMNNRLVPLMQARRWGRVVAIASGLATKPQAGMPAYSATKAAIINLAVSLAMALADSGVTSNSVSPGIILTPGLNDMFDKMGIENSVEVRAKMASEYAPNPLGRAGFPQEIADAVVFLASSRADYINGQNLHVDGGYVPTVN
jgi:NAD(P)-dependent dehydrogenase (short-subunit alcohol dehydrogenase family)